MSYIVNKIIPAVVAEPEKMEENELKSINFEFEKDGVFCRKTNNMRETLSYDAIPSKDFDAILAIVNKINPNNPIEKKTETVEP